MLKRALAYWRLYGTKALLNRVLFGTWRGNTGIAASLFLKPKPIGDVLKQRFQALTALPVFSSPSPVKRINLITDSINSGSLFGGVATSIILTTLWANRRKCPIRLITRTEKSIKDNFFRILQIHGLECENNVEFTHVDVAKPRVEIDVCDEDLFITTSWWSTTCVKKSISEENIVYLIQEDERMFYPYGDDHLRCHEMLENDKIRFIVNSKLLYEHFLAEGYINMEKRGIWFEPSFEKSVLYKDESRDGTYGKKNFFFYARPNNLRNLFFHGIEVIDTAVSRGILNPDEWELYFVGKDVPKLSVGGSYQPIRRESLTWHDYCGIIRRMDLGFCLMYTPHPSYPPLDLAASGAVVVTNRFGLKQDLGQYSKNIICTDTDVESLVQGIADGVRLASDRKTRDNNYQESTIGRDWIASFVKVLQWLDDGGSDVSVRRP